MGGGDVGAVFEATLDRVGTHLTPEDLTKLYPPPPEAKESKTPIVLEDCKFFDLFDADPVESRKAVERQREDAKQQFGASYMSQILMSTTHHPLKRMQTTDYRLTPGEKAKLASNGVVAVERMAAKSFADIYYHLYTDDMPVFVTADSVLHAWHRSFDAFLVDVEVLVLSPTLDKVLETTLAKCIETISVATKDNDKNRAMVDVELYLRVALSLLRGNSVDGLAENKDKLNQLLDFIHKEKTTETEILSAKRNVDFSQFKPRGHYTKSEELMRYFRSMIWLGTIDFRISGGESQREDLHQLDCAVTLVNILQESNTLKIVEGVDALISSLVADGGMGADSLSPAQLATFDYKDMSLEDIQNLIVKKKIGAQLINGHPRTEFEPLLSTTPMTPPTSFALLGQRFVWSSFIFSRLVFDHVLFEDEKQKRRIPSAVDIAFTLFGNDSAAQVLADRMNTEQLRGAVGSPEFVPFRDGIPFSSNLVALRQLLDQEFNDEDVTSSLNSDGKASISMLWQRALRALSRPSPNPSSTFHSNVWNLRKMNTQLGSFTQLRHDTLLYAKQSCTIMCGCEYADGMVDPYPVFWQRMQELARQMVAITEKVLAPLVEFSVEHSKKSSNIDYSFFDSTCVEAAGKRFFLSFADTMQSVEEIASLQVEHKPLSDGQVNFLKTVMEERFVSGGSKYCGWYPGLFYESREDAGKSDVIVADVHTDSPSTEHMDPGGILHLGVGNPLVAFFVVDNTMFAGPVFSSYEFVTPIDKRLTDEEFERKLPAMQMPEWASGSYLC
ncbi:hypothetical protein P3T76_001343 [Phytophthora citrophthora]|uniref:Uncharacterized protein n=1 Tax=Phytophthora citrophthora TaxID=4793 RepID=A0AAD9LRW1_9STRA|nr:hypothetical protein P3T76_001343 [Phytophthora citrophthora]